MDWIRQRILFLYVLLFFPLSIPLAFSDEQTVHKPVTATLPWTQTGVFLKKGDTVRIQAKGVIANQKAKSNSFDYQNGPEGTFLYNHQYRRMSSIADPKHALFPLPAADEGKWPAYALIGKVGSEGKIFFVGREAEFKNEEEGELSLGVNDFNFSDNKGSFEVDITLNAPLTPPEPAVVVSQDTPSGKPVKDAAVILIYIDGLRPDTIEEMINFGHLPNIREIFYEQGLRVEPCFSVYESNTVVANSVFMTGKWPSETGVKNQAFFERFPPTKPSWWSRLKKEKYPKQRNLLSDTDMAPQLLKASGAKTFYDYLGDAFLSSVTPINPQTAPMGWPHMAVNTVENPFFSVTEAYEHIDDVNGKYLLNSMLEDARGRVFLVWFPGLDNESHMTPFGQFGGARRELANIDRWIGRVRESMVRQKKWDRIYMILFSDHGSMGGDNGIYNQNFDIGTDFFFKLLKANVKNTHYQRVLPGTNPEHFVYIDNMGRGQAKVYLPVGDTVSGNWSRPNTFYELTHYRLGPNREPVNLIDSLASLDLSARNVFPDQTTSQPVDLVMTKINERTIYVKKQDGTEALILIQNQDGAETYRYVPVRNVGQDASGALTYDEQMDQDPFQYLSHPDFHVPEDRIGFLKMFHPADEWLKATYETEYPDAPVVLAKVFGWSPPLAHLAKARDPDLLLSASKGWDFFHEQVPGTDHGYLRAESMRIPFLITGPNMKRGVLKKPYRLVNLAPTVFQMIGFKGKTEFDASPIEGIYAAS